MCWQFFLVKQVLLILFCLPLANGRSQLFYIKELLSSWLTVRGEFAHPRGKSLLDGDKTTSTSHALFKSPLLLHYDIGGSWTHFFGVDGILTGGKVPFCACFVSFGSNSLTSAQRLSRRFVGATFGQCLSLCRPPCTRGAMFEPSSQNVIQVPLPYGIWNIECVRATSSPFISLSIRPS